MSEVVILALAIPLAVLATAAAFWFASVRQEKHLLAVLDRFLSRNMSEYAMTDLVKREIEVDQQADESEEAAEEEALLRYLERRRQAEAALGAGR